MFERFFGREPSPLVDAAFEDVSRMLRQSHRMLDHALDALVDGGVLEADLESMDDRIDEGERMVRRSILEHLAFNPRRDLLPSLLLASVVQEAERLGDDAIALSHLVPLATSPRRGPFADRLRSAGERLRPLFEKCETSLRDDDPEIAREVMDKAREVNLELGTTIEDLARSEEPTDLAVVFAVAARILGRIAAHLSNIASSVAQPYDRIRHEDEET